MLDLIRSVMGEVHTVSAVLPQNIWRLEMEESALVHHIGAGGVGGSLHTRWTAAKGYRFSIEAYGDDGMAMVSYAPMFSQPIGRGETFQTFARAGCNVCVADISRAKAFGWRVTAIDAFVEEFDEFGPGAAGPVMDGSAPTGFDGKRAIGIANGSYRCAKLGRPVELSAVVSTPGEQAETSL